MATSQTTDAEETSFLADMPIVSWRPDTNIIQWKGFWLMPKLVKAVTTIQNKYKPLPTGIILASFPKTGTTWLKALTVIILSQNSNPNSQLDPLATRNPHELVPFLELETFGENPSQDIKNLPSPRVFNTHLPYSILPDNVKTSRIVYISRNPADTFVSHWLFFNKRFGIQVSVEDAFEELCKGVVPAGPFFDHVLEYWKEREQKNLLFLTYEELKEDPNKHVKRLAQFLGCSLSSDEIEQVVWKCSHERLTELDVNKGEDSMVHWTGHKFGSFFRRGVVGDWKNHLTPAMVAKLHEIANQKWEGSGLEFNPFVEESEI